MLRYGCHRFRPNEVRLWLSLVAYNLGNLWRRLPLPHRTGNWSLTSLQQRLLKAGGRLFRHARHYWLLLAERSPRRHTAASTTTLHCPTNPRPQYRLASGGCGFRVGFILEQ